LLAGLFLAAGLVLAAVLLTRTWMAIADSETISVTGSARRTVSSDLIIWNGSFSIEAPQLIEAQRALAKHRDLVGAFFTKHNLTNWVYSPVAIEEIHPRSKTPEGDEASRTIGYRLRQGIMLKSGEVQKLSDLTAQTTELLEQGVEFVAGAPDYIYTKAGEAKVEMLAEATKDARARAEQIAGQGGRFVRSLKSARMGVFQITPVYSTTTAAEGVNDTTSQEKTVTATVTARFSLK
jgi:hypothetical protein